MEGITNRSLTLSEANVIWLSPTLTPEMNQILMMRQELTYQKYDGPYGQDEEGTYDDTIVDAG
jgi:hypothetical protein